jgi:LCP family protein required for cell wall assembly
MSDFQKSGSDLPRPRKPIQVPQSTQPAENPVSVQKPQAAAQRSAGTARQSTASRERHTSQRSEKQDYGSDTLRFSAVQEDSPRYEDDGEGYDAQYEQRRAQQHRNQSGRTPASGKRRAPSAQKPRKSRHHRRSLVGRIIRTVAVFAAVVFLLYSALSLFLISRLEKVPSGTRTVTDGTLQASYVTSILLIGTDARDASAENGRSDSMILLSVNTRTKTIYLTSFMRDAYVDIPEYGSAKLNAAYSYGGAELLMDTLEENYGISIDDYMSVSFEGFASIIDAFGGVEVTLSDAEAQAVNDILLSEVNELMGDARDDDFLSGGGSYVLDGKQALSYSRIRYVGNADFERTSRQREVMTQLFSRLKTRAVTAMPQLISSALPHMTTNMQTSAMYLLSLRLPFIAGYSVEQQQIPADGTWSNGTADGQSVLQVDFAANTRILEDTVYAASK